MRVLILNADYPRFLAWFYRRDPQLEHEPYARQMAARNASLFGLADFYSRNFAALGHQAAEIHVNNARLQSAWAREHGLPVTSNAAAETTKALPGWLERAAAPFKPMLRPLARKIGLSPRLDSQAENILLAQVEEFRPDMVLNQDLFYVDTQLARRVKDVCGPILIGQVGIEPPRGVDWSHYDLMLSQLPRIVQSFRAAAIRAEVIHLAFEPAILDALPPAPAADIDISFVGSVSADHGERIALLEAVAERFDLRLFGAPPRALPASSPLHRCHCGEVWGAEMYQTLRRSKITLNSHIDLAGKEAGNMRLFEATGVGTFLLTDFKQNLHTLFEPDRDVAIWRSIPDCLSRIECYLRNDGERRRIAQAGQAQTLRHHTYRDRILQIENLLESL